MCYLLKCTVTSLPLIRNSSLFLCPICMLSCNFLRLIRHRMNACWHFHELLLIGELHRENKESAVCAWVYALVFLRISLIDEIASANNRCAVSKREKNTSIKIRLIFIWMVCPKLLLSILRILKFKRKLLITLRNWSVFRFCINYSRNRLK